MLKREKSKGLYQITSNLKEITDTLGMSFAIVCQLIVDDLNTASPRGRGMLTNMSVVWYSAASII